MIKVPSLFALQYHLQMRGSLKKVCVNMKLESMKAHIVSGHVPKLLSQKQHLRNRQFLYGHQVWSQNAII